MTTRKAMQYKLRDGTTVPLFEAPYDMSFKVWKSDKRKAIIGDPYECIEALGLCRMPNVMEAHVGSGKVAYVVFEKSAGRAFKHALRFTLKTASQKVRDTFDQRGAPKTQILILSAPTNGQTMLHMRDYAKERARKIKKGEAVVKPRGEKKIKTRFIRLGVNHRPRAVVRSGIVSFEVAA